MKCWICGNDATSREHMMKASDLRAKYPDVTQKKPIFLHTDQKMNQKIGSVKSDKLKFNVPICAECNNVRTANYDRAWESLSKFLTEKDPPIKKGDLICLDKVFYGSVARSMLYVHLFFVKLFGCNIIEKGLPIDIVPFAESIMYQRPHPKVYIDFESAFDPETGEDLETGPSEVAMQINYFTGRCVYATWFYIVGSVLVNVRYAEPSVNKPLPPFIWHPSSISNCLHIGAS